MADAEVDRRAHWQAVYEGKTETEVSWFQPRPASSLDLIGRCALDAKARIIDVGGGASRLVDHLLALGFRHLAVLDIADAALAKVQSRLGADGAGVHWVVADVTQWRPEQPFDLWHDRAVFHFLTEEADRQAYARNMAAAVRPGGYAVIGTFAADGPERCSGLPVCRYDTAALAAAFSPDFAPLDSLNEDHLTPAGKLQRFQFCRLQRL